MMYAANEEWARYIQLSEYLMFNSGTFLQGRKLTPKEMTDLDKISVTLRDIKERLFKINEEPIKEVMDGILKEFYYRVRSDRLELMVEDMAKKIGKNPTLGYLSPYGDKYKETPKITFRGEFLNEKE